MQMMDSSTGMNGGQDGMSSPVLTPSAVPEVSQYTPSTPTDSVSERTYSKSEVTDLVRRARQEASERERRLIVEQPEYAQRKYSDNGLSNSHPGQFSQGNPVNYQDEIRKIVSETVQRDRESWIADTKQKQQEQYANQIVNQFTTKISQGKDKYADFEKVTGDMNLTRFPNTVELLASHVDNAADVLYELGKNRIKMANLESLAERSGPDAIIEMQRLAQSIKNAQEAANVRVPNEPLSQMRQTNVGLSNGTRSVSDYRAMFKSSKK
jgi:hypothetical protein